MLRAVQAARSPQALPGVRMLASLPKDVKSYEDMIERFTWNIPASYNIGVDVCDRHAAISPTAPALVFDDDNGNVTTVTFSQLKTMTDRLANVLAGELGVRRGDRLAVLLPQCLETALAHIAVYKLGAIAVPLFTLFGPEALEYRLGNSRAMAVIAGPESIDTLQELQPRLPSLQHILTTQRGGTSGGYATGAVRAMWPLMEAASSQFTPVHTSADDPALIIYTSGTTGPPKGCLHAHRVLLGHLPGVEMPHDLFPQPGDLFWTPADWAWIGGLLDVLLPALHHGVPVLAFRAAKFDPDMACVMMHRHNVRNVFMPPTALKLMRQHNTLSVAPSLRTIGCGGETLGEALLSWTQERLGVCVNEFYGQTEANLLVSNCNAVFPVRAGSMGRAVAGRRVAIIDDDGNAVADGTVGRVAVHRPDPVMFLRYWEQPEATQRKFIGDWMLTGDMAKRDEQGYFWYFSRDDDVITTSGYRVGPGEVEDCLIQHPAVAMAGVIGVPDAVRTEVIKAYVVLTDAARANADQATLQDELKKHVSARLAKHEYPRQIEFVDALPMTTTGKIIRGDLKKMHAAASSR